MQVVFLVLLCTQWKFCFHQLLVTQYPLQPCGNTVLHSFLWLDRLMTMGRDDRIGRVIILPLLESSQISSVNSWKALWYQVSICPLMKRSIQCAIRLGSGSANLTNQQNRVSCSSHRTMSGSCSPTSPSHLVANRLMWMARATSAQQMNMWRSWSRPYQNHQSKAVTYQWISYIRLFQRQSDFWRKTSHVSAQ